MDINLNINESFTEFDMGYHYGLYEILKQSPESKFDFKKRNWIVKNEYVKDVLEQFKKEDIPVSSLLADVKENIKDHKESEKEVEDDVIKTNKINVKESGNKLQISFKFDRKILEQIKKMSYRKWNNQFKVWEINKNDVKELIELLNELEYVDLTELEKYYGNVEEIELKNFSKMERKPYDYQVDVAKEMLKKKRIINSLEAGLGKTFVSIMTCESIEGKKIIITPASVKENWAKEIYIVNPDADITILEGKDEWKKVSNNGYVILNYDIIDRFISDILKEDFLVSIFDEAHKIRGINNSGKPSSKRAKFALQIAGMSEYVYPLTATPYVNYTKDIFNLLAAIDNPLSRNWFAFANKYCDPQKNDFGVKYNGSSNEDELNEKLDYAMIRMLSEDKIDLPEKVRSFVPVKINLNKYHKEVQRYMDKRNKLDEVGQHLVYLNVMRRLLAVEKAKHAISMADDLLDQGEQVVIFTNYTEVVDKVVEKFKNAVKVTGDVTSKQRQKNVDLFQQGKAKVLVSNMDAGGEGITLTASSNMIIVDMHWSPVFMTKQVEKRVHRISQTKPVNVKYLYGIGAEVDEIMVEMLESKLNSASMIVDGKEEDFVGEVLNKL